MKTMLKGWQVKSVHYVDVWLFFSVAEAWNLTIIEGLWVNCSTPILTSGDEECVATDGRGQSCSCTHTHTHTRTHARIFIHSFKVKHCAPRSSSLVSVFLFCVFGLFAIDLTVRLLRISVLVFISLPVNEVFLECFIGLLMYHMILNASYC